MVCRSLVLCLGLAGLINAPSVAASISLSATRVIFDGAHREANIMVRNSGQTVLVQSWLDSGDNNEEAPPFAVTPPLARAEANQQQLLRILYEGQGMPSDKESVVWLNVQEIPQSSAPGSNVLQLAVRQRIKVFFRPDGLIEDPAKAPELLAWRLETHAGKLSLSVSNDSKFYVSIADIKVGEGKRYEKIVDSTMIGPGEKKSFALGKKNMSIQHELNFSAINDYGAQQAFEAPLFEGVSHASRVVEMQK
ncbi:MULTISPECIES: fimbrial biogenesis chaperone [unclassified Pseudomonas]|uniref:fimbrial biogenesis chaperone n=1 Tax=unclassified Pseudomonas TaxID=196821 RepID=UPI002579702E|nr:MULTISPECIES: molecular chaperone [unclassified Pseudomonas]